MSNNDALPEISETYQPVGPPADFHVPDPIYAVDYEGLKYRLTRQLEQDREKLRHGGDYFRIADNQMGVDTIGLNFHVLPGKLARAREAVAKWPKIVKKLDDLRLTARMRSADSDGWYASNEKHHAFLLDLIKMLEAWLPVANAMNAAKSRLIKGRKPSLTPRQTEPRTLENTGSCSVCDRNIKIPGGVIYDHGFTLRWNSRQGKCPGVGYKPFEIAPDGAVEYLRRLRETEKNCQEKVDALRARDPNEEIKVTDTRTMKVSTRTVRMVLANMEGDLRSIQYDVKNFDKRVREWKTMPLPMARPVS